jgi:hypothetical protein
MHRVTLKTSTIFIAKKGRTQVYHSVGEIPRELRQEIEDSTNGFNSSTILIADRRGREEIRRALNGLPSSLRTRLAPSLEAKKKQEEQQQPAVQDAPTFLQQHWWKIAAPATLLAAVAAYFLR